ncbi:transforming acidic coiled-coil-containing protein 3 [Centropristis striata]|uniref:transforming acidic coiled-coil-containing protein 3 n=1 Tax=Centropristis striata TaxID=184440 RepID=UPI0027DF4FF2|nr:transforming acidic coiled-coil-containing protein 3 [Centropristis striata]XP_059210072.1 transforming acidic coiled-coil-containing protein 3 [Centropristis striata]
MSSVAVNDENCGVCPGGKQNGSINDIFALDQPTGRPSILRQTENLPSKTMPKGVKVCFQTPRRDPVTKRIVSPTKSAKMASLDECTKAMESLRLDKLNTPSQNAPEQPNEPKQEVSSYPDDEMPIQSKGGYQLDFDNLEAMDPFQCSNKMVLSPARPAVQNPPTESQIEPENILVEPTKAESALDETLPFTPSVENSLADLSANISSTESSVVTVTKVQEGDEQDSCIATPDTKQPAEASHKIDQDKVSGSFVEDAPLPVKGSYNFDFDNLDAVNPFQTGSSKIQNSPVLGRKVPDITPPLEETQIKEDNPANVVDIPEEVQEVPVQLDQDKVSSSFVEDAPLPAKGSYNFDFDNLDAVNPFQTGGSKIQNSPVLGRKVPDITPPLEETQIKEDNPSNVVDIPQVVQEVPVQPEMKPIATVAPISANAAESTSQPADAPCKEGPVKLEFNFDDGSEVKRKPPPKKFGKRPPGLKPKEGKPPGQTAKPPKETPVQPDASDAAEVLLPKGSYSLDLDKLDDPNFNPFGTAASMSNSPKCSKKSAPVLAETSIPEQPDKPVEKEAVSSACSGESIPAAEANPGAERQNAEDKAPSDRDMGLQLEAERPVESLPELCQPDQKSQVAKSEFNDEFVPGTVFMANDFDGQIDYLEQFGSSSFKESALRKQSLYLKFDPLLRDSPKKSAGPVPQTHDVPRPAAFASRLETLQTAETYASGAQKDDFKLFDDATAPAILATLVPPFPQPANTEDAIIEVLKYSQKDMDDAIARVQAQAKEQEDQWSAKYKKILDDGQEMRKIIAEFELVIAKMMADQEKEREVAQEKLKEALLEKDQVSSDLNTMERSFSDLFKRLEKYKDVVEGYKKNEVALKACAQDYLERIKKEEQRYQTLKAHAEEKISHANDMIADVRSKNKAELSALQAQLRREQLKVQSLDKSLDQKVKECEELTKLCDELITNVGKG